MHNRFAFIAPMVASCALAAFGALGWRPAVAALGGPASEVPDEARQMQSSVKVEDRSVYRIHSIPLAAGGELREYSVPGGNVFAVAWNGPANPDLRALLGHYFDDYVSAAKGARAQRHHLGIYRDDLVIEAAGHMRAFSGRAYLPTAMPAGAIAAEIR